MVQFTNSIIIGGAVALASAGLAFASPASAAETGAPSAAQPITQQSWQHQGSAIETPTAAHRGHGHRYRYRHSRRGRGHYRPDYRYNYPAPVYRPDYRYSYPAPVYRRPVVQQYYYQPYAPRDYSEPVYYNTHVWRERDDAYYYCRRRDGTTGLLIGAALGGLLGNRVAYRGERTAATVLGALNGAAIGRAIDGGSIRCR